MTTYLSWDLPFTAGWRHWFSNPYYTAIFQSIFASGDTWTERWVDSFWIHLQAISPGILLAPLNGDDAKKLSNVCFTRTARVQTDANYGAENRFTPHTKLQSAKRLIGVQAGFRQLVDHSRVHSHHPGTNTIVRQPS